MCVWRDQILLELIKRHDNWLDFQAKQHFTREIKWNWMEWHMIVRDSTQNWIGQRVSFGAFDSYSVWMWVSVCVHK